MSPTPFARVMVDHVVDGLTRVWWRLAPEFQEPGPYVFQLQTSKAGTDGATDWIDVGVPAVNAGLLVDDQKRLYGQHLHTFYRIRLTTFRRVHLSTPATVRGLLDEQHWSLAREIIRKEQLRAKLGAAREGLLLRRIRYGVPVNRDPLTDEVLNSRNAADFGTGFKAGYFQAVQAQCWDVSPAQHPEKRQATQPPGQIRPVTASARILAFPPVDLEDVWVDARTDERWLIHPQRELANLQGVPLLVQIELRLAPFSHVIYRVPVDCGRVATPPDTGHGSVAVDQNWGGVDALRYADANGDGIGGASILAFLQAEFDRGLRGPEWAKASTSTDANGRWLSRLHLEPAAYTLVLESPGRYGPDTQNITVAGPPSSWPGYTPSFDLGPQ